MKLKIRIKDKENNYKGSAFSSYRTKKPENPKTPEKPTKNW